MIRLLAGLLCLNLAIANESDPKDKALAFLKAVREQELDLGKDTALFPQTTAAKKKSIESRLDQLAEELDYGNYQVIDEKREGDLAGVLISQTVEFDPSQVQVHAVGMILRDEKWLPAPLPASFENTGIRYVQPLAGQARKLEEWMIRERARKIEEIRSDIREQMLEKIRATLTQDELVEGPPEKLVNGFVEACRKNDLPAALAYLGGLDDPLPEFWQETVALTATGIRRGQSSKGEWARLISERMLRATVHTEVQARKAFVSIGDFDPLETRPREDGITIRHFSLSRNKDGAWRLELPVWLDPSGAQPLKAGPTDKDLTASLPLKLLQRAKPAAFEDPKVLGQAFLTGLSQPSIQEVLSYVAAENEEEAKDALLSYASTWRDFHDRQDIRLLLDASTDGDQACALFCELDPYNPELRRDRIQRILMVRDSDGWRLGPDASPAIDDFSPKLQEWSNASRDQERSAWLEKLGLRVRLGGIPADSAPDEKDVEDAAENWVKALSSGQPKRIFERVAIFDDDDAIRRLFAYLGQELSSHSKLEMLGTHRNGRWAAVSVRHRPPDPRDPAIDLLHPIINTSDGPKALPEGILYIPDSRAREYLNDDVWKRLGKRLPKSAVEELKVIHEKHTELCRKEGKD